MDDYSNKSFKEIYIETLINLTDRDDLVSMHTAKTFSLIWRLSQSSIANGLIGKMFDFVIDTIISSKGEEDEKILKSVLVEMVRHSIETYK